MPPTAAVRVFASKIKAICMWSKIPHCLTMRKALVRFISGFVCKLCSTLAMFVIFNYNFNVIFSSERDRM